MSDATSLALSALLSTGGGLLLLLPWLDRESSVVRRSFFFCFCCLKGLYFGWRITCTLPSSRAPALQLLFAYVFLVLELVVTVALYRWLKGLMNHRERSREADEHADWWASARESPRIDIFLPTYNEPWEVLEKTLVGACAQDYARSRVWVLDDGRRDWLRARCAELGVGYFARPDNAHAKAGNLNNALRARLAQPESPDFVAVLDADFVPRRGFVRRCLSLMHDPKVGIVQTPQYHYNFDPFQQKFRAFEGWPDTQRFVFSVFQPARDAEGGAYCCGTSFLARTEALRAIAGFPTESVTEDVLTTVKMNIRGFRTVFLGEPLSAGLAPEGLHEYLTQRGRWCLGSVQLALWLFELDKEQRSLWARLWSIEGPLRWGYTSLLRLVFLMVPVIYWLTGVAPFTASTAEVLLFAVPVMLLQRAFLGWMSRGTQLPLVYEATNLLASMTVVRAFFKGLLQRGEHRFVVTDKGMRSSGLVVHWGTLRWFIAYAVLLVGSMSYAVAASGRASDFGYINFAWSVINLALVAIAAAPCFEEPRRRLEQRYPSGEAGVLRCGSIEQPVTVVDLSLSGALLTASQPVTEGEQLELCLAGLAPLRAGLVREGAKHVALAFNLDENTRRDLIARLHCGEGYLPIQNDGSLALTLRALWSTAFR